MMPSCHVLADADRGAGRAEAGAQHQDARHHVGHVGGAGVDGAAEQVDEQQHQDDRQHQRGEQHLDVAPAAAAGCGRSWPWRRRQVRCRHAGGRRAVESTVMVRHGRAPGLVGAGRRAGRSGPGRRRPGVAACTAKRAHRGRSGSTSSSSARTCGRSRRWRRRRSGGAGSAVTTRAPSRRPMCVEARPRRPASRSSRWSATWAFSSAGVPCGDDRAAVDARAIRSASWSASSRYWVVRRTVDAGRTRSRDRPATWPAGCGRSSPVVGSSRKITDGRPTRPAARSSRRRMPPE